MATEPWRPIPADSAYILLTGEVQANISGGLQLGIADFRNSVTVPTDDLARHAWAGWLQRRMCNRRTACPNRPGTRLRAIATHSTWATGLPAGPGSERKWGFGAASCARPNRSVPVSLLTAVTALAVLASALPLTLSATSAFLLFPFLRSGHIHLHCAVFLSLLLALSLGFALTGKNKQPLWLCPQPGHPWECLEDLIQISGERPDIARGFRIPPQCRWSGPARRPAPVAHGAGSSGVAPAPCRPAAPIPPRLT